VLIPIQCEYYALEGLSQLLKNVELIRGHLNTSLHVSTILLTMYDGAPGCPPRWRTRSERTSPSSVLTHHRPSFGQDLRGAQPFPTVMTYDPTSSGALSYLEAARELAEQVLTWNTRSLEEA
jgi:chromosome partitioning protein